ncbi:MAG: type II toxin-antitoxin system RelE/ParE family toxin [Treponemataceae bacterium]|nr:type II toxin-antitoxin system RelE/ParE family toxin [Treponemataceae bacterium]
MLVVKRGEFLRERLKLRRLRLVNPDLRNNVRPLFQPFRHKPLVGDKAGLWRYRVGDYRIICDIQDDKILVTILRIAHRREVYRGS